MTHYPRRSVLPRYGSTRHPRTCYGSAPIPGAPQLSRPAAPASVGLALSLLAVAVIAVIAYVARIA